MTAESTVNSIGDIVASGEFRAGLRFGLLAGGAGGVFGALWRLRSKAPAPVAGLFMAAATVAAVNDIEPLPGSLVLVLAVLAAGGLVDDLFDVPMLVRFLLPVPGAWLFATRIEVPSPDWFLNAAAVTIVVGGALGAEFDRRYGKQALGPAFLAIAAAGVFATVPDTERARILVVAFAAVAVLGWPIRLCRLGSAGTFAALGIVAWVVGVDGYGREGSLVGGLACCLGLLAAEPAAALVTRALTRRSFSVLGVPWVVAVGALLLQLGSVYVASRVAGFRRDPYDAAVIAGIGLAAGLVLMAVMSRAGPAPGRSTRRHSA